MSAVAVHVPGWTPRGWSVRWRVRVGDRWGAPGELLPAPAGPASLELQLEAASVTTRLRGTTTIEVEVAPAGVTTVRVAPGADGGTIAPLVQALARRLT